MNVRMDHMGVKTAGGVSPGGETPLREKDARRWNSAFERELTHRQASPPKEDDSLRERVSWRDSSASASWMAAPRHSVELDVGPAEAAIDAAEPRRRDAAVERAKAPEATPRRTLGQATTLARQPWPGDAPEMCRPDALQIAGNGPDALGWAAPASQGDAFTRPSAAVAVGRTAAHAAPVRRALSVAPAPREGASPRVGTPYGPRHLQWTEGADGAVLWIRDADPAFDETAAMRLSAQMAQTGGMPRPARVFLNGRGIALDPFPKGLLAAAHGGPADSIPPLNGNEEDSHAH